MTTWLQKRDFTIKQWGHDMVLPRQHTATIRFIVLTLCWTCSSAVFGITSREQIDALLSAGQFNAAAQFLAAPELSAEPATRNARLRLALLWQDYLVAEPLVSELLSQGSLDETERELVYTWLFARDDRAEVERRTISVLDSSATPDKSVVAADFQAAGRLALELLKYERAENCFRAALQHAKTDRDRAAALKGLGQVAYKRLDFDGALAHHKSGVALHESADGLMALAETLIRLARTDEAIAAAERAVSLNPYHELAHYYLGNGYARKNYTELAAQYGSQLDVAVKFVRSASDAFARGNYRAARDLAMQALERCPEYGRAHNALAKALELERNEIDVHRADYERRFDAIPLPVVPGIDKYVLNWDSLSRRHQKRVAMSIAPWKAFIPILIAGGSTHFIKPLHLKLSETPGMETLKDQRINTDARLWDDVRGAGGFATVTGIEDVERSIFDKYNTVLHELTHQVHGVFTADQAREIQEHYRRAKDRESVSRNGFLSRYASGTVWEYFAEGANAIASPQRDAYDPREVVLQRLESIDPDLQKLVTRFLALTDLRTNLPIAFLNAGNNQLEKGLIDKAMTHFQRALAAAPRDEAVLGARLYGLAIKGEKRRTVQAANELVKLFPASGSVQATAADALWHSGKPLPEVVSSLMRARAEIGHEDKYLVDLALGGYFRRMGDVQAAIESYDLVLKYQSDNPEAMWGKGATLALAGRWDEAFSLYEQTLRLRTGVVELRNDYARDLLMAGRRSQARAQVSAALLLDPTDPTSQAIDGWLTLLDGDAEYALRKSGAALASAQWNDLARLVNAKALNALGKTREALAVIKPVRDRISNNSPPAYIYRHVTASWISVHELPAVERKLLNDLLRGR